MRDFARQAAAELLVHLIDDAAEIDLFFAVIGAEENELASFGLHAGQIEHRLQRNAGPAAVAREALQRAAIAGALEAEHEFGVAHLLQLIEREGFRPVHQPGDLQRELVGFDHRMAEVLRGEELIFRREGAVDLAYIESAPFGARRRVEVGRLVRERDDRFALRERGDGPLRQQGEEAGGCQSSSHRLSTGNVL